MIRDEPITEARSAKGAELDALSTFELARVMNREDATVADAVAETLPEIGEVIDAIVGRLRAGGRLVYVGAGSSGGHAALDSAECQATFSVAPDRVLALVAGKEAPTIAEREAAEDDAEAGASAVEAIATGSGDAVIVVSASGSTPYAIGAAKAAADAGAFTACIVSCPGSELARVCDRAVCIVVGPEVLAGSTRLKAGTAQKLVLNMLSTISMIRLGKTYAGLMVDVVPANEKLRARVRRLVGEATGASPDDIDGALAAADGEAKVAILMLVAGVDPQTARKRLAEADGNVRLALSR